MKRAMRGMGIAIVLGLVMTLSGCIYDPGYYQRTGVVYHGDGGAAPMDGNAAVDYSDDAYDDGGGYAYAPAYYYGPGYYGAWPYYGFGIGFYGSYYCCGYHDHYHDHGHDHYHGPWRNGYYPTPHGGWASHGSGSYGHGGGHSSSGGHSSGHH